MSRLINRRDVVKLLGGTAVGTFLSPLPWKLTDDLAIWTQNWSWTPRLARGPISTKWTTCSMCPSACGVRAMLTGGRPFALAGAPGHPLSRGFLCPAGLAGHHLATHGRRLLTPVRRVEGSGPTAHVPAGTSGILAEAAGSIARRRGRVAILDARPGRALSHLYRDFLSRIDGGLYVRAHGTEGRSLAALEELAGLPAGSLGYDLEEARTILSFGAPILDGWSSPATAGLLRPAASSPRRPKRILHAETRPSESALAADRWLRILPGSEGALALGIAHVLIAERLVDVDLLARTVADFRTGDGLGYEARIASWTPERSAHVTGLPEGAIASAARELASGAPSIVIGGGDPGGGPFDADEETAIQGLNVLLGSLGGGGAVIPIGPLPEPGALRGHGEPESLDLPRVQDGSIATLVIDGASTGCALPWSVIRRKLVPEGAVVVAFASHLTGIAARAGAAIPVADWTESFEESPTPPGAPRACLAAPAPLQVPPAGMEDPASLVASLAALTGVACPAGSMEDLIASRVGAIHAAGRGCVVPPGGGSPIPVASMGSASELREELAKGGLWIDDPMPREGIRQARLLGPAGDLFERSVDRAAGRTGPGADAADFPLIVMPFGYRGAAGAGALPPLVDKLFGESGLRHGTATAWINPATAASMGLRDGARARLETREGAAALRVACDPEVAPALLHVQIGPDPDRLGREGGASGEEILTACSRPGAGSWRIARARVTEA